MNGLLAAHLQIEFSVVATQQLYLNLKWHAVADRQLHLGRFVNFLAGDPRLQLGLFNSSDVADVDLCAQSLALLALYDRATQSECLRTAEDRQ